MTVQLPLFRLSKATVKNQRRAILIFNMRVNFINVNHLHTIKYTYENNERHEVRIENYFCRSN